MRQRKKKKLILKLKTFKYINKIFSIINMGYKEDTDKNKFNEHCFRKKEILKNCL